MMTTQKSSGSNENTPPMPYDPRLMQAMYGYAEEDEIDLRAYAKVIWAGRKFILSVALGMGVLVAGLSLLMPNIYRAEVLLAPVSVDSDKGSPASILGGLGGLASLAGLSLAGGGSVEENLAVITSRTFIWHFVEEQKLMPILFADDWDAEAGAWLEEDPEDQPNLWSAWRMLVEDEMLIVNQDADSGLVRLSIDWPDPELATTWANTLVQRLNAHLREQAIAQSKQKLSYLEQELTHTTFAENRQALFQLISSEHKQAMLANTQQDFAFRVLDVAQVPDKKLKPKRAIIAIAATFVFGFLAMMWVLVREGMRKSDESDGQLSE